MSNSMQAEGAHGRGAVGAVGKGWDACGRYLSGRLWAALALSSRLSTGSSSRPGEARQPVAERPLSTRP